LYINLIFFSLSLSADIKFSCLTFNTWQNAKHVDDGEKIVADIIAALQPDIVSFSEVKQNGWEKKIITLLEKQKLKYFTKKCENSDVSIISKFPINSAELIFSDNTSAVKYNIQLQKGEIVVIPTHLDFKSYACNLPRGYNSASTKYPGWKKMAKKITDQTLILKDNARSKREKQIFKILESLKNEKKDILILGDFNEPSCLDWTEKTKKLFAHNGAVVEWSSTKLLDKAGFKDAFRVCFPDELKNPGITWPSVFAENQCTSWAKQSDDRERIDYIFYKGNLKPLNVAIVGPEYSFAYGKKVKTHTENETFLLKNTPWPSDHKAVYAEFIINK
jgi:endonuclease/exonuclease/phosphatase family metal-dependent hydrolase